MINKLIQTIKAMAKKNEVSKEETKVKAKAPEKAVEQPKAEKLIKSKEVSDELTQETLDAAIELAANEGKTWDKISQEERWIYIKEARK